MSESFRAAFRRVLRLENRRAAIRHGRVESLPEFESKILRNRRQVTIYLPAGYDDRDDRRFPVLYMQDGQNLFDASRAYIPGQHWRLQEAADTAVGERTASPLIIVGIDHAGTGRLDEYTPTRDAKHNGGGRANDYGRMLVEELKPVIDSRYRTRPGATDTAIGGSSLGGLVALHVGLTRADTFSRIAAMSPSVWWGGRVILRTVETHEGARPKIWLDIGGREGAEALRDARLLRDALVTRGWTPDEFRFHEDRRGDHSERAWARRGRHVLEFLFPPA